jgi:hypothetical protein
MPKNSSPQILPKKTIGLMAARFRTQENQRAQIDGACVLGCIRPDQINRGFVFDFDKFW